MIDPRWVDAYDEVLKIYRDGMYRLTWPLQRDASFDRWRQAGGRPPLVGEARAELWRTRLTP